MGYKNMLKDIANNELKKVYLLFGSEMYLKDSIIKNIKDKYIESSFELLNYTFLEGKSASQGDIINACETLPFMSDKKVVVVEDSPIFKSAKAGEGSTEDILSNYIENISDTTCLIFIVKEDKVDNRKKILKSIKKIGRIVELEKLKYKELDDWIISEFSRENKTIDRSLVSFFLDGMSYSDRNAEKTLYDLENEINKVVNYAGDKLQISREDIEFTKPKSLENDIFKLIDFISQKNPSLAIEMFNDMILSGEPVQLIIHMIVRQIRLLLASKMFYEKGMDNKNIGKEIKVYQSFVVQKLINQGKIFSEKELIEGLKKCRDTDLNMKTGKMEAKLGVEILIIELSQ